MNLKCSATCKKVIKKSQSPAFKKLEVGDIVEFSTEIKHVGGNKGTYATYIQCHNRKTDLKSYLSFNQIEKTLNNFEFEEIESGSAHE